MVKKKNFTMKEKEAKTRWCVNTHEPSSHHRFGEDVKHKEGDEWRHLPRSLRIGSRCMQWRETAEGEGLCVWATPPAVLEKIASGELA